MSFWLFLVIYYFGGDIKNQDKQKYQHVGVLKQVAQLLTFLHVFTTLHTLCRVCFSCQQLLV